MPPPFNLLPPTLRGRGRGRGRGGSMRGVNDARRSFDGQEDRSRSYGRGGRDNDNRNNYRYDNLAIF